MRGVLGAGRRSGEFGGIQAKARPVSQNTALCTLGDQNCAHFHSDGAGGSSPLLKLLFPFSERCTMYLFKQENNYQVAWKPLFAGYQCSFSWLFAAWPCSKREREKPKPTRRFMTGCSRGDGWEQQMRPLQAP